MENSKDGILKDDEVIALLVGFIVGVGFLAVPNAVTKDAKQDGCIAIIVGAIYPLILSLLAVYFSKKHPNENILQLSRRYLGKVVGQICNVIFLGQFVVYYSTISVGFSNIMRVFATPFLSPLKIFLVIIITVVILENKGIKILARINKFILYFMIVLSLILITALKSGNYLNILPLFGSGYKNIIKGSIETAYAFGGMEAIFLIYPLMINKNKVKKVTFVATFICTAIYTWITFLSIYFLGYKLISKTMWSTLLLTESINFPILNTFRFLFLFLWNIVVLRCLSNFYYATVYCTKDIFKLKEQFKCYFVAIFTIIIIFLCLQIPNEVTRRKILSLIFPKITLFNIIYIFSICVLIFLKNTKIIK